MTKRELLNNILLTIMTHDFPLSDVLWLCGQLSRMIAEGLAHDKDIKKVEHEAAELIASWEGKKTVLDTVIFANLIVGIVGITASDILVEGDE